MKIDHLSHSQWRAWHECPAAAHAQYVTRAYAPGTTEAMALGTLTEAAMTRPGDAMDLIADMRPAEFDHLLTTKGVPTKDAERAVQWGRQAAEILDLSGCSLQAELRPLLGGVTWHCRIDVWDRPRGIVWDVKTCPADPLGEEWVPRLECRGNFIASRGYGYQLALYREAVKQETGDIPDVGIIAIGKHKTRTGEALPNLWCFVWQDTAQLDGYLDAMRAACLSPWTCGTGETAQRIPWYYDQAASGLPKFLTDGSEAKLPRCETCDWCVASRENRVRMYSDPTRRQR